MRVAMGVFAQCDIKRRSARQAGRFLHADGVCCCGGMQLAAIGESDRACCAAAASAEYLFMQPSARWIVLRVSPPNPSEVDMRRSVLIGAGTFALLASVSLAAAQGMNPPPSSQSPSMQAPGSQSEPGQGQLLQRQYNQGQTNQGQTNQGQMNQNQFGKGQISLNDQQRQTIWQTLSKTRAERAPSSFQASIGSDVPRTMRLHSFSRSVTSQVPTMRGLDYAKLQDQVLIVDPKTRKVVDTVSGS
jgi:hypothetical protein